MEMERWRILHKETDYTVIDNGIFKDSDLTLSEKGFLCTVMSLPDDWEFSTSGMAEILHESLPTVKAVINRLVAHGYCKKGRIYHPKTGKIVGYEYTFLETKNGLGCASAPQTKNPSVEKPAAVNPPVENFHQLSTKDIKYSRDKVKNNIPPISPFDFVKALREIGVTEQLAREWMAVRKTKRLTNTRTAFDQIAREIAKTGRPASDCVRLAVENSWGGFKAEWMKHETQHVTLDNLDETIRRLNDGTYTG